MEWTWHDVLGFFHLVPHAVEDLKAHEDPALVRAGLAELKLAPHTPRHRLIMPEAAGTLSIQKDMNPGMDRSEANLGLLLRDYLHNLHGYDAGGHASQALLEHWRHLLLEQPRRLADAQHAISAGERSREFWRQRLSHYHTAIPGVDAAHPIDDWERAAGQPQVPTLFLKDIKSKQWQDLVIRQRIHDLDLRNMGRG